MTIFAREDQEPLAAIMGRIRSANSKPVLVVVDPVRKYLKGNEDSSDVVNEFMCELEKPLNSATPTFLAVHHLKEGGEPTSLEVAYTMRRGSSVITDRARFVLAMYLRGGKAILGVPAPNGQPLHNNLPGTMLLEPLVLNRNPMTMCLDPEAPMPSGAAGASETPSEELCR